MTNKQIFNFLCSVILISSVYPSNHEVFGKNRDVFDGGSGDFSSSMSTTAISVLAKSDDEDYNGSKDIQSSAEGPPPDPDIYPSLDPYTKTRSTATIVVDVAIEHEFKSYMLPGAKPSPNLKDFKNEIIKSFRDELKSINVQKEFKVLSLRPGPFIKKKINRKEIKTPSVFARVNITQYNASIIDPLILFQIYHCGRRGVLGNLTVSDQIIFPQYICQTTEVYCLPDCQKGSYCDGIVDCRLTQLDEPETCPKCLHKNVKLISNVELLNEDEDLQLTCDFNEKCEGIQEKVRWKLPYAMKELETQIKGQKTVSSLIQNSIVSGVYECSIDGESSSLNITVSKRPEVSVTRASKDAEMVMISEIEGSDLEIWCNATDGEVYWYPVAISGVKTEQLNKTNSKLSLKNISTAMEADYRCQITWGVRGSKRLDKIVRLVVICDSAIHFQCHQSSVGRKCISINQKCDKIQQCFDGSDENNCVYCKKNSLSTFGGPEMIKDLGDAVMITCSTDMESCKPLTWMKDSNVIHPVGNVFIYKQTLFIVNATVHHSGNYQCMASDNRTSTNVSLTVVSPPQLQLSLSSSDLNLTFGQSYSVDCSILSDINDNRYRYLASPIWMYKNGEQFPKNVHTMNLSNNQSKIVFEKADATMGGDYSCTIMWGARSSKNLTASMRLHISPVVCRQGEKICADRTMCVSESLWCDGTKQCHDASDEYMCPKCLDGFVFVQPSGLILLPKQTAEVHCYYHKDCYPVEWRIVSENKRIESIPGISIKENRLIFENVETDATGIYECFSGDKHSYINVTVLKEISLTLINNPGYVFTDFGRQIEVECQSNYGQPIWKRRDSKSLDSVNAKMSYTLGNVARLSVSYASYETRGYYICYVQEPNSAKELASRLMYVHVYELECPKSFIKCDQNTQCVLSTKVCDGVKDCTDGADEKNCSNCNGDLQINPGSLTITTGGWSSFTCIMPSDDCMPIKWTTISGEPLNSKVFYPYQKSLYIFNPSLDQSGIIVCTNGKKSSSAMLTVEKLTVTFEPRLPENSSLYIMKGDNQNITCRSNFGNPSWIIPSQESVLPLGIRYLFGHDNVAIMQIEQAKDAVEGQYTCSVSYSRESIKKSVSIKVS